MPSSCSAATVSCIFASTSGQADSYSSTVSTGSTPRRCNSAAAINSALPPSLMSCPPPPPVRRDGPGARAARLRDDRRLPRVLLGVEDLVLDAALAQLLGGVLA